ncbi:MAG: hypothetical protein IKI11_09970 [Neisseriaceae bacterium]|nr:hypothetical protein [Neisseriaceae bacterium]
MCSGNKAIGLHNTKDLINAYRRCGGLGSPPYNAFCNAVLMGRLPEFIAHAINSSDCHDLTSSSLAMTKKGQPEIF